tara:strand:- start:1355 stop:3325 length:1971 start_codon:yes stop_codon:yes gene_type:complete
MTFTLPTTGTDPKATTKSNLETAINAEISTLLVKASNLSDLTNASTARTNLGLGDTATQNAVDLPVSTATQTAIGTETAARIAGDDANTDGTYFAGPWDASSGSLPAVRGAGGAVQLGDYFDVSVAGTVDSQAFSVGDRIKALVSTPSTTTIAANWYYAGTLAILAPLTARVDALTFTTIVELKALSVVGLPNGTSVLAAGVAYQWNDAISIIIHQLDTFKHVAPNAAAVGAWVREYKKPEPGGLKSIAIKMMNGRVDFVGIGDSNQLFAGQGWDSGFQIALSESVPRYATALISTNENDAQGAGIGDGYGFNASQSVLGAISGAPAALDAYLNKGAGGLFPPNYAYLASGTFSLANNSGLILTGATSKLGLGTEDGRYHLAYGTFASGSGQFICSSRFNSSPQTEVVRGVVQSTNAGAVGMGNYSFDIPADASFATLDMNIKLTSIHSGSIVAPYFATYQRYEVPGRTTGYSYHTLNARGGQSARTMAYDLQQMSDTALSHFFEQTRRLQGTVKTVVICVNSGLNDRGETLTSVGPNAVTDGDSADAFVDNHIAIVERVKAIWSLNSWNVSELHFLLFPSHPINDPDDAELISYRTALESYVNVLPNSQIINLAELTNEEEMVAEDWYANAATDRNHLKSLGYVGLASKIADVIN